MAGTRAADFLRTPNPLSISVDIDALLCSSNLAAAVNFESETSRLRAISKLGRFVILE